MDEWMHLSGGEAAHRQQEQRAMRRGTVLRQGTASGQRVRTALAALLIALAARLAPAEPRTAGTPQPLTTTPA